MQSQVFGYLDACKISLAVSIIVYIVIKTENLVTVSEGGHGSRSMTLPLLFPRK
jgi:hypothetical protein